MSETPNLLDTAHPRDTERLANVLSAFAALEMALAGWEPAGSALEDAVVLAGIKIDEAADELRIAAAADLQDMLDSLAIGWRDAERPARYEAV